MDIEFCFGSFQVTPSLRGRGIGREIVQRIVRLVVQISITVIQMLNNNVHLCSGKIWNLQVILFLVKFTFGSMVSICFSFLFFFISYGQYLLSSNVSKKTDYLDSHKLAILSLRTVIIFPILLAFSVFMQGQRKGHYFLFQTLVINF